MHCKNSFGTRYAKEALVGYGRQSRRVFSGRYQFDESTDIDGNHQLSVFVQYVNENENLEEFLLSEPLKLTAKGTDAFNLNKIVFKHSKNNA